MQAEADCPSRELNGYLHNLGLGHLSVDEAKCPRVSDLAPRDAAALSAQLRQALEAALDQSPPIEQWESAAEELIVNDDGSSQAQQRQDHFWQTVSTVVFATHALVRLGDKSVFPLLIAMARSLPGHPQEQAVQVLRRYVEAGASLSETELIERAEAGWRSAS